MRRQARNNERGITLLLVAISLVVIVGMAALGIDVVTLYVARTEAQRAADAAALAGAKVIANTGFTSGLPFANASDVCGTGSSGAANQQAIATAQKNLIAGQAPTVASISCNLANPQDPTLTVTVQRTGLPTFFSRIWGNTGNSVSASATAEAYNPSGQTAPISVASVKPFLVPNCDPTSSTALPCTMGQPYFISSAGAWTINPSFNYVGTTQLALKQAAVGSAKSDYYLVADMLPVANICPGSSAPQCGGFPTGVLADNIACANPQVITCANASPIPIHAASGTPPDVSAVNTGLTCLTHGPSVTTQISCSGPGNLPQDCFIPAVSGSTPVSIQGGTANPNSGLIGMPNISRSDSVVTVPVFDASTAAWCNGGTTCDVIGFLQLGVQDVRTDGTIDAVVLNAAGCGSSGGTAVSGGAVSPVPVRLIHN